MKNLLIYIGIALLIFNLSSANAEQVIFAPVDDQTEQLLNADTDFKGAVNLPHPVDIQRLMQMQKDENIWDNLLLVGAYFHFKYPDDTIERDFSEDIRQIFPDLNANEIENRTKFVRTGIQLFRWGKEKYDEIKEKVLVPPEPPLIVSDDEYAEPENFDYIATDPDETAIKYDFKKVVSYSSNARDMQAVRAKKQRDASSKKYKTDYEQFRSKVGLLELRKIPFYGYDIPNPLIGNAGIGSWQEKDFFKVRLISEMSEYASAKEILGGIHIIAPAHRFMLASDLSETLKKPAAVISASNNIKSFDLEYPVPYILAADDLVGGYAGDFLIPFKITPHSENEPVSLEMDFAFYSCNSTLDCSRVEFKLPLEIQASQLNNYNSFQNFIQQAYYNIPHETNKDIEIERFSATMSENKDAVEKLNIVLKFKGQVSNPRFFVEDDQNTNFSRQNVTIHDERIYISFYPLNNQDKLRDKEITFTAQINQYDKIRQKLKLSEISNEITSLGNLTLMKFGLLAGLLFIFTPVGLFGFCISTRFETKRQKSVYRNMIWGILSGTVIFAAILIFLQLKNVWLYWGIQYQYFYYLSAALLGFVLLKQLGNNPNIFAYIPDSPKKIITGIILILLTPAAFIPYFGYAISEAYYTAPSAVILTLASFSLGCCLPYILMYYKKGQNKKAWTRFFDKISQWAFNLEILFLYLLFFLQYNLTTFLKVSIFTIIIILLYKFIFYFDENLLKTTLPNKQKKITEKVLSCFILAGLITDLILFPPFLDFPKAQTLIDEAQIKQEIEKGNSIFLTVNANWCIPCKINQFLTFNYLNTNKWTAQYHYKFITADATFPDKKTVDFLRRYQRVSPPLSLIYTFQIQDGLLLGNFIFENQVTETLRNLSSSR